MSTLALLEPKFTAIGARVKEAAPNRFGEDGSFRIDVKADKKGQYFEVANVDKHPALVLDARPDDRHLVLMVGARKMRFLCGHDEREWFTCAVPGVATTVMQAKQALKAAPVATAPILAKDNNKRRMHLVGGGKIIRQGEFFFIPDPHFNPKGLAAVIHRNEPMSRGAGSKPHMAEFLSRRGGTTVWVSRTQTLSDSQFRKIPTSEQIHYTRREADAEVWVKGCIRHPDHATVNLKDAWHRVEINTEGRAAGAKNVRFID